VLGDGVIQLNIALARVLCSLGKNSSIFLVGRARATVASRERETVQMLSGRIKMQQLQRITQRPIGFRSVTRHASIDKTLSVSVSLG